MKLRNTISGLIPPLYKPTPNLVDSLKRFWNWLCGNDPWPKFKPGVFYNDDLKLTEIILEDTYIVWHPWGPYKGHAVDCGYDADGNLIGIKIWDDVRTRKEHKEPAYSHPQHPDPTIGRPR